MAATAGLVLSGSACALELDPEPGESQTPKATATQQEQEQKQGQKQSAATAGPDICSDLEKQNFKVEFTGKAATVAQLAAKHSVPGKSIETFSEQAGLSNKDMTDSCVVVPIATVEELSDERFGGMDGYSWREGCLSGKDKLRLVTVPYRTYTNKSAIGQIVVNKNIAEKTATAFGKLYTDTAFQINSIKLIEDVAGGEDNKTNSLDDASKLDEISMEQDNTSAFNCRNAVGATPPKISSHGKGLAIDINPKKNPYFVDDRPFPSNADPVKDRTTHVPGLLSRKDTDGALVIDIFEGQGFSWGGDYKGNKDFQHFVYDK